MYVTMRLYLYKHYKVSLHVEYIVYQFATTSRDKVVFNTVHNVLFKILTTAALRITNYVNKTSRYVTLSQTCRA